MLVLPLTLILGMQKWHPKLAHLQVLFSLALIGRIERSLTPLRENEYPGAVHSVIINLFAP